MWAMVHIRQGIGRIDETELVSAAYSARLSVAPNRAERGGGTNEKTPSKAVAIVQLFLSPYDNRGWWDPHFGGQHLRSGPRKLTLGECRKRFADGLHRSHRQRSCAMSVRLKGEHLQLFRDIGPLGLRGGLRKYLNQGGFLEQGDAQNLQHSVKFQVQSQTLAHDGHQHVDGDGCPDLRLHGVLGESVERFDAQVLLDPFEEQLDLPAALVQLRNGECGQGKIVGEKNQLAIGLPVAVADAAQILGIAVKWIETHQADGLVAAQTGVFVDGLRGHAAKAKIFSCTNDEKRQALRQGVEPREVQVRTIEKVEGAGFRQQLIEDTNFVDFGWFYIDSHGDAAKI